MTGECDSLSLEQARRVFVQLPARQASDTFQPLPDNRL